MSRWTAVVRALKGEERATTFGSIVGERSRVWQSRNRGPVSPEQALKNSVWWAGLTLRADLMSTFPVDVVRDVGGIMTPVTNAGPLVTEPAPGVDITQHLYSRQFDLDSQGNSVGIITARNAFGLPSSVELQPLNSVRAIMDGGRIKEWRIDNKVYTPIEIWHEKQYTMSGMGLGLSPLASAAWAMGIYESSQEFALEWFGNGAMPRGVLRNTKRDKIEPEVRRNAKAQFREATQGGDIFITGVEWEWLPAQTTAATSGFLEQKAASEKDVARYVGVPAGMLDVEISTGNITYANATQANLQFLVTKLGPAVVRMQNHWSRHGLPKPWKLRLNTDALLRMDLTTKAQLLELLNRNQLRTKTELRSLDNLGPYDPDQLAELTTFAQMAKTTPTGPVQKEGAPWLLPA